MTHTAVFFFCRSDCGLSWGRAGMPISLSNMLLGFIPDRYAAAASRPYTQGMHVFFDALAP